MLIWTHIVMKCHPNLRFFANFLSFEGGPWRCSCKTVSSCELTGLVKTISMTPHATMKVDRKDVPGVTERTTTGFSLPATKPKPRTGSRLISTRRGAGGTPSRWTSSRELLCDTWLENAEEREVPPQKKERRRKKGKSYNLIWLWLRQLSGLTAEPRGTQNVSAKFNFKNKCN